ncbi:S53 family peptidase [Nocardioides mesophilus]|uniref:S8/S53 family peptidase n=1 Tax=Nocardioides mesophilus TaxID=433659 RepID=A0A7G9R8D6_9ACTN|nr:S53 family peptidase [Nocardioides mesophilus]QNN51861.1 S8/S53 family peptidase [Nocardioides mesophilus]
MIRFSRSSCAALAAAALITSTAGVSSASPQASATRLDGSRPAWAVPAHRVAPSRDGAAVDFKVQLEWRNPAAAARYAAAAASQGTATSGAFLTPAQFRERFAPSRSDVASVTSWLRSQGFQVRSVPANRKYVEATGTVRQAARAFRTSFSTYRVQGMRLRANDTALRVPASLRHVQAVTGLDQSEALVHSDSVLPAVFRNARPCSKYWGEKTVANTPTPDGTALPARPSAFAPCGYAGKQLQGAYGLAGTIASGVDGSGVTVAVVDAYASSTVLSDLNTYSARNGLPTMQPGQFREIVPPGVYRRPANPQHDPAGWSGEETLDVEAVHTMAPGAKIIYAGAPNNRQDMNATLNMLVDKHLADIVTNSYGFSTEALPPGYIKSTNDILIQAAATGISMFFSSGDGGDHTGGDPANAAAATPDWPASSPWVTAVGGTSLGVTANDTRLFELGWETGRSALDKTATTPTWTAPTFQYGSGGGTSRLFAQPDYQKGVVPAEISQKYGSTPMRAVPDVSAVGDPTTGMLVGQTQRFPDGSAQYSEYRIGGTSLSSPLYAGMFALVVQKAGHRFGLANPALYAARATTYDITKADLATYPGAVRVDYVNGFDGSEGYTYTARWFDFDNGLTIHVRPQYDDVTGIGSPEGTAWLDAVAGYRG